MSERDKQLLATMVYEAVRFSSWAVGEGITPVAGEPAKDPGEFISDYVTAIDGDDYAGLAEVARDAISGAPPSLASAFEAGRDAALEVLQRHFDGYQRIEDVAAALSSAYAEVNSLIAPPQSAASTVEPVAYVPLDGDKPMWSETHPRKLRDGDMALYAAPTTSPEPETLSSDEISTLQAKSPDAPSSPEPDAVRERLNAWINEFDEVIEEASFEPEMAAEFTQKRDDLKSVLAALSRPAHGGWEEALRRIRDFPHNDTMCEQAMAQIAREALADPRNDRGSEAQ